MNQTGAFIHEKPEPGLTSSLKRTVESTLFQVLITITIVLAGALAGLETYSRVRSAYAEVIAVANDGVLLIFVIEMLLKIGAEGKRPLRYFKDGWNCFDFAIIVGSILPFGNEGFIVLRLFRLLRVLKLVRALPKLQILVSALLKSIPSMGYVTILLMLLFYVYAVAGVFFFGKNDPIHFPDLETAMLSLSRVVTLEDWTDIMYINMFGCHRYGYGDGALVECSAPHAQPLLSSMFFLSFVLIGTMIVLNLFVGVIMTEMNAAQEEALRQRELILKAKLEEQDTLGDLESQLGALQRSVNEIQKSLTDHRRASRLPELPKG